MKAIPPNPFVPKIMRKRKPLGNFRHTAMKCGVETSYLQQSWKARCHCFDTLYGTRQVKRSKRNELAEFSQERCIHPFRRRMVRSAVDHSMTGGSGERKSQILCCFGYALSGRSVLWEFTVNIDQNIIVLAPNPELTGRQADTLHRTLRDPRLFQFSQAIEGEFQRRRAAVDRQNDMFCQRHTSFLA